LRRRERTAIAGDRNREQFVGRQQRHEVIEQKLPRAASRHANEAGDVEAFGQMGRSTEHPARDQACIGKTYVSLAARY
jgi:hypothetical protein